MAYSFTCKNITKSFQTGENESSHLKDIQLDCAEGDFISIIGPSGSGKSTLLSIFGDNSILRLQANYCSTEKTSLNWMRSNSRTFGSRLSVSSSSSFISSRRWRHLRTCSLRSSDARSTMIRKKRALELLEEVGLADKIHSLLSQTFWWTTATCRRRPPLSIHRRSGCSRWTDW